MVRFPFGVLAICCTMSGATLGCTQLAGLGGEYRHGSSGGRGGGGDSGAAGGAGGHAGGRGGSAAGGTGGDISSTGGATGGNGGGPAGTGGAAGAPGLGGAAGMTNAGRVPVRIGISEFHDASSGTDDTSAYFTSITLDKPAGTAEGDFMLVLLGVDHTLAITKQDLMMAGWTLLISESDKGMDGQGTYLMYRFASAAEPASYVFADVNPGRYAAQGLLAVYRGVNRTPINDINLNIVDMGTEGQPHVETPTLALTTTVPNCLLLAGLSPDTTVDSPVITSWPPGFGNAVSVKNPPLPYPNAWTNLFLAEQPWPTPATVPASSIGWNIMIGDTYYGAVSFVLALAPAP